MRVTENKAVCDIVAFSLPQALRDYNFLCSTEFRMQIAYFAAFFFSAVAGLTGVLLGVGNHSFRGIGITLILSFLLATWIQVSAFGITCDIRVLLAGGAIVVATLFRLRWLFDRLLLADLCVAFLWLWQVVGEWNATGGTIGPLLLSYGYWVLPYVVGRCSARHLNDFRWLGFFITGVCLIYGVAALVETMASGDLFELLFGEKPGKEFHRRKAMRWGFVRCEGPFTHPIFFGIVAMLLLPWSVWLCWSGRGKVRIAGLIGFAFTTVALVGTISRGPVLATLVSLMVTAVIPFRKLLLSVICLSILTGGLFVARPDYFEGAALWFSRINAERETAALIGDEVQINTSSMTRVLLIQHYWKSVVNAGIIGYGMTATDTFPPNVPHVPFDEATGKQYPLIDNSYILLTLRGGWLQCLAFVLLHFAALYQLSRLGQKEPDLVVLCRLLAGAICGHALVVFTVYPDYDFMFVFLWTVGITSVNLVPDEQRSTGIAPPRRVRA